LEVKETVKLTATIAPADATNIDVTWSSSNEEVATVDEEGLVFGLSDGIATITVTTVEAVEAATTARTVVAAEAAITVAAVAAATTVATVLAVAVATTVATVLAVVAATTVAATGKGRIVNIIKVSNYVTT
jgi:uncharacterized protein YjdB